MKNFLLPLMVPLTIIFPARGLSSQPEEPVRPAIVRTGRFLGVTGPLRDLPVITEADEQIMREKARRKLLNEKLEKREYPFAATALPKGPDPVWQQEMGQTDNVLAPVQNFGGQDSPYYPPDCNGSPGPDHYFQMVNTTYAAYSKTGSLLAGPTNINLLFNGVTGSGYNDGDPVVLYDEQAGRWFAAEFSISGNNDYMLIAVSTSADPTGTWYAYSFDVADMPDYPKFGVWSDGYYMGTNNSTGNDIYVFERSKMLAGQTPQMVGFNNPWRPMTIDGFMCVPPVDCDGPNPPAGSPGLFMTINDDAIGGGSDQLWIYELAVNWSNPTLSTFTRSQQIDVPPFDSDFGNTWSNITQPGTTAKLDAIPMVVMNVPQYRNAGIYQTIVCCHTVDVDNTNHAGVRWYELRRSGGSWTIRQTGTFAPDANSRWMGSIMMNGQNELGLGYSVSSSSVYPGIRYTGQSSSAYAGATGVMDITEDIIQSSSNVQTATNRWGDYSQMAVDAADNATFWFTSQYPGTGGSRKTRIAAFLLSTVVLTANFSADNLTPLLNTTVIFSDNSVGGPTTYLWSFSPSGITFVDGTTSASKNPHVQFTAGGTYAVTLQVTKGAGSDTETKTDYIHAGTPGLWAGTASNDWNTSSNWNNGLVPSSTQAITIPSSAPNWPFFNGNLSIGSVCGNITLNGSAELEVAGDVTINPGYSLTLTGAGTIRVGGSWTNPGIFTPATGTVDFTGSSDASITPNQNPAVYITNYSLSGFTKGMTPLTSPTTGPAGDDAIADAPIGFTFVYLGTACTTARISTNGWLSLNLSGTTTSYDNTALFSSTVPNMTLAPWFDDLRDDNTSVVSYKTEGSSPNRVFTAEWYRVRSYASNTVYVRISFQAKLFETTNSIEFHYGTVESGTHNASESASVGIENGTGGPGNFIEATTGSTTTGITNLNSLSSWPAVNYRFTPPSDKQTFYNVTISKTGVSSLQNPGSIIVNGTLKVNP